MLRRLPALVLILLLVVAPGLKGQQGGTTTYAYDDDGRLIAVISPLGEASLYEYDEVGNFTRIRRFTANELAILAFTPSHGPSGTVVTIYGTGFNQGVNSVSFNGVPTNILASNLATVIAEVPASATTGLITAVTPRGSVTSTKPFVVRGLRVIPEAITIGQLETVQFSFSISGTPTNNVIWSVHSEDGSENGLAGTISETGLYTAPNLVGQIKTRATVRATSVDQEEIFDEAIVTILPDRTGFQLQSDGLSVRYGTPPNTPPTFINDGVSVRYGTPANKPPTFINDGLSVRYGTPANNSPTFINEALSITRGPVLSSVAPASITRGTNTSLTITGVALNGATGISFFNRANGTPASGITISNITVNSQGTSLSATITIASNTGIGSYVVVVTTPNGSTVRIDVGSNLLQIN